MADEYPASQPSPDSQESSAASHDLTQAYELLEELLRNGNGVVSTMQLKRQLIKKLAISEPKANEIVYTLQFPDVVAQRTGKQGVMTYHHGRSFYSQSKYNEVQARTEKEADAKGHEAEASEDEPESPTVSRQNRQEEARLGAYVKTLLEDIYGSDFMPDDVDYVFDVHNERPGSTYENVDLIAVHWRSEKTVDLVSVEVKLDFSATAVHQACNYARFSNRVWVAAVVSSDVPEAAMELRSANQGLFDYAVSCGLGIIACRRRQGGAYHPFPIHWPRWHYPEPVESELFLERYRAVFEQAQVVEPRQKRRSARF
jgi:hypothetical protein